ncbi:MAG: hypothetical protein ACLPY5_15770 [Candidatus Bathyarchaeia archaeon]
MTDSVTDLRATTPQQQQVEFEVSRLVPENAVLTSTGMDKIENAFSHKVKDELERITFPVSAVVVVPERNWSVEGTYPRILSDVKSKLTGFPSVPSILIHVQHESDNGPGWLLLNANATNQLPPAIVAALVGLGFTKV